MSDNSPSTPELLVDQIDALRVLRADTDEEKGRLLEQIGGKGIVEQEMVSQMSAIRPLHHPDRFEEAHRIMMRGIEVLDRNGPLLLRRTGRHTAWKRLGRRLRQKVIGTLFRENREIPRLIASRQGRPPRQNLKFFTPNSRAVIYAG